MRVDLRSLKPRDAYQWLIATITPRPIAWVSSIDPDGRTNLAPFSFFNGVTSSPPSLLFVPVNTREGTKKDTLRNIEAVPEFVVNLVPFALAEKMNATSAMLPYGESEFSAFGVASAASIHVRPPRVAAAPVSFECVLHQIVPVGEGPAAANIVIGLIVCLHVDEAVLGADGLPDPSKLDLIGRMGGDHYVRTGQTFSLSRPGTAPADLAGRARTATKKR
jgi:flavin reductase (DIM6/NTAB) family NADH-FMN oxidoreductase RutF